MAGSTFCFSCRFFDGLDTIKNKFAYEIYNDIAPQLLPTFTWGLYLFVLYQGVMIMIQPGSFRQRAVDMAKKLFFAPMIAFLLSGGGSGGSPIIYDWIITPIFETTAIKYGAEVLSIAGEASGRADLFQPTGGSSPYAQLASMVEQQIFGVIKIGGTIIKMGAKSGWFGALSPSFLLACIAALLLILPYLFVLGIFAAFLVEAMFKILAMGIISPLLVVFLAFPPFRPFTVAGARILFGASLTIIFACGAMGFSMSVVDEYKVKTVEAANCAQAPEDTSDQLPDMGLPSASTDCSDAPDFYEYMLSGDYLMLFVIGFASILLHLQAKSLASNISGANDGAGPAAAVVGAAKMTLGAGMAAAGGAMFGSGGMGSTASQAMRGEMWSGVDQSRGFAAQMGQAMQQHGALGGAAYGMRSLASQFTGDGGGSPPPPQRYSAGGQGGGQGGGGMSPRMEQTFDRLAQVLERMEKGMNEPSGGQRDRTGAFS